MDYNKEIVKMLMDSARNLAQYVASASMEFWQRKDFRLYIEFAKMDETEQDRLFNELEVSILGLFVLNLDNAQKVGKKEFKGVLKMMQDEFIQSFLAMYTELGVEKKFVDQWQTLIELRLKEYREDLQTALKESEGIPELSDDEEIRVTWARVETITIDCLSHLRRGKVEDKDPLWKLLRKWFITLDSHINPLTKISQET